MLDVFHQNSHAARWLSLQGLPSQIQTVCKFYAPLMPKQFDDVQDRLRDLERLRQMARSFHNRSEFLSAMALDPPEMQNVSADGSSVNDDYLVLATMESVRGREWDVVYVPGANGGGIPSQKAFEDKDVWEAELRLFYVALTRAKDWLYVVYPLKRLTPDLEGADTDAKLSPFLPDRVRGLFSEHLAAGSSKAQVGASSSI